MRGTTSKQQLHHPLVRKCRRGDVNQWQSSAICSLKTVTSHTHKHTTLGARQVTVSCALSCLSQPPPYFHVVRVTLISSHRDSFSLSAGDERRRQRDREPDRSRRQSTSTKKSTNQPTHLPNRDARGGSRSVVSKTTTQLTSEVVARVTHAHIVVCRRQSQRRDLEKL